ncbi:MAG: hypothetical protein NTU53_14290 [Planctomycetota bacterium]|nr:hypothetical protein [Planctomycetota bacterium]
MKIERIKRWQWMLISLVVGGLLSSVRLMYGADVDGSNSMNSQSQLELGLMREERGVRYFKDLVVYPNLTQKDKGRRYYIVMGKYYSGRPERQSDGKFLAVWRPYFFVETAAVYTPRSINLASLNKPGGPDYAKKYKAITKPTVLDFLAIMKEAKGINYSYAWWAEPGKGTVVWMGASFVLIGLIWPSVVSLLAYGTLTPPVEEKGTDLSKVRSSTTTGPAKPTEPTEDDMDELKRMERALEEKIKASDRDAGPAAQPAVAAGPAPIKQLTATTSETMAVEGHKDEKEFGAKADDFYPTERTGGKPKPDQKHG